MKKKKINPTTIISVFIIFAIIMSLVSLYLLSITSTDSNYFGDYNKLIQNELEEQLNYQLETDNMIEEKLNYSYTLEKPCVLINPYKISPLSALIIFDTEEDTEVQIFINDMYISTVKSSKKHIIPIYGLYANANNYVKLKTKDKEKTINIKTNSYDNSIDSSNLNSINENERLYIFSNSNNKDNTIRAFDKDSNLMFYLKFGYISGIKYDDNHFNIAYNSKKDLRPINLEIDYLGRIFSISTDISDMNNNFSKAIKYSDFIDNYNFPEIVDNEGYSSVERLKTSEIQNKIVNSKMYDGSYDISQNGDYLTFNFDKNIDSILLIKKDSYYTYEYDIDDKDYIKIDMNTDASIYVKIGNEYYSLITTIKN